MFTNKKYRFLKIKNWISWLNKLVTIFLQGSQGLQKTIGFMFKNEKYRFLKIKNWIISWLNKLTLLFISIIYIFSLSKL